MGLKVDYPKISTIMVFWSASIVFLNLILKFYQCSNKQRVVS